MMGIKVRSFSPLPYDISLEELVPEDNFYRRLEARLDLAPFTETVSVGRFAKRPYTLSLFGALDWRGHQDNVAGVVDEGVRHDGGAVHLMETLTLVEFHRARVLLEDEQTVALADAGEAGVVGQGFEQIVAEVPAQG